MAKVSFKLDPKRPAKLTAAETARLNAMTSEEITNNAKADHDNPPMTGAELDRAVFARFIRQTREKLGLTQIQFAERFGFNLSRLKDLEQGRFKPDSVVMAYMKVIAKEPKVVERALDLV